VNNHLRTNNPLRKLRTKSKKPVKRVISSLRMSKKRRAKEAKKAEEKRIKDEEKRIKDEHKAKEQQEKGFPPKRRLLKKKMKSWIP